MTKFLSITAAVAIFLASFGNISKEEPVEYRVVLDPGHGGINIPPSSKNGDRFEPSRKEYLAKFRPGAEWNGYREAVLMYKIATEAYDLLMLTRTNDGFKSFEEILKKHGYRATNRSVLLPMLSRPESITKEQAENLDDPNGPFRIFDYPSGGKIKEGRLSRINRFKPNLVISLHCDYSPSQKKRGLAAIIAPNYNVFADGFERLKKTTSQSPLKYSAFLNYWLMESGKRSEYFWYLNDCSIYFTGYRLESSLARDDDKFLGYKHNMVTWAYNDYNLWPIISPSSPAYAASPREFSPAGLFWDREKSIYEKYRRDGGPEGFGGDNHYASMEIIRGILSSLEIDGEKGGELRPVEPYMSAWTIPILVNAISAYVEIGYLKNERFRRILSEKPRIIAEGVAVAAYTLLCPVEKIDQTDLNYPIAGKNIDLSKYNMPDNRTYFEAVSSK